MTGIFRQPHYLPVLFPGTKAVQLQRVNVLSVPLQKLASELGVFDAPDSRLIPHGVVQHQERFPVAVEVRE